MKTPEDIAFPYNRIIYERQTGDEVTISAAIDVLDVYDIIRQAQTETWNEALDTTIRHLQKVTTRGDILYTVSKLKR